MRLKFLVTAGPTREAIDDVRFLSNRSTGSMGFEIARAALEKGHEVVLVAGPTSLTPPEGVRFIGVDSAVEMRDAVLRELPASDALVMAAAVADYRPAARIEGKRRKDEGSWFIELVRNPDILKEAAPLKGGRVHVGFALESGNLVKRAKEKLEAKDLDLIVGNDISAFGVADSSVVFIARGRPPEQLGLIPKSETARKIVAFCEGMKRG